MPITVQTRDLSLLRDLFESRVMTSAHAAALHFSGSKDAAKKRLQKLKAAELLSERTRRPTEPAALFLTAKGFAHLRDHGALAEYPALSARTFEKRAAVSELTLRHELEVMDVKAAFHLAVSEMGNVSIPEFGTWPLLHQFDVSRNGHQDTTVKPDGFIRIHEKQQDGISEHAFFLEVDRSSESLDTLVAKAHCYLAHYHSGGFAERNGAPRTAFKEYPFRVLIVCKSAERRNNTALRLLQNNPPIFTHAHLTTLAEVTIDPFGAVWLTPAAYRDAVKGTSFDATRARVAQPYRSQPDREAHVEKHAAKCVLLS
jgi:Replication-relaxation